MGWQTVLRAAWFWRGLAVVWDASAMAQDVMWTVGDLQRELERFEAEARRAGGTCQPLWGS